MFFFQEGQHLQFFASNLKMLFVGTKFPIFLKIFSTCNVMSFLLILSSGMKFFFFFSRNSVFDFYCSFLFKESIFMEVTFEVSFFGSISQSSMLERPIVTSFFIHICFGSCMLTFLSYYHDWKRVRKEERMKEKEREGGEKKKDPVDIW